MLDRTVERLKHEFGDSNYITQAASIVRYRWQVQRGCGHAPLSVAIDHDGRRGSCRVWIFDPGAPADEAACYFDISDPEQLESVISQIRSRSIDQPPGGSIPHMEASKARPQPSSPALSSSPSSQAHSLQTRRVQRRD